MWQLSQEISVVVFFFFYKSGNKHFLCKLFTNDFLVLLFTVDPIPMLKFPSNRRIQLSFGLAFYLCIIGCQSVAVRFPTKQQPGNFLL